MGTQTHRSDSRVLSRRTLERDHRRLKAVLAPGMCVLDAGCGTGAITAGIARKVGPAGEVVGLDRDESLLAEACESYGYLENLSFRVEDIQSLSYENHFDVVTAARVLQWVNDPELAMRQMCKAVKPGGRIVVLDYNHADLKLEPEPPAEFAAFYDSFLRWRDANGWRNRMGDNLPQMFASAGLSEVQVHVEDELSERGDEASSIWCHVMDTTGMQMVEAGFMNGAELQTAINAYGSYVKHDLNQQTLVLRAVEGWKSISQI